MVLSARSLRSLEHIISECFWKDNAWQMWFLRHENLYTFWRARSFRMCLLKWILFITYSCPQWIFTMFNSLKNCKFLNALQMRLLNSRFWKSPYRGRGVSPLPHPPPARSLRSLAEDLRQMSPLRDFAPPKPKVFRRAWPLVYSTRRAAPRWIDQWLSSRWVPYFVPIAWTKSLIIRFI